MAIEMIEEEAFNQGTQIKVIGVGGGGGNAVEHMIYSAVGGVEFIAANTDSQALSRSTAHKTIQLGAGGLGAGSKPDKGREAAMLAEADIRAAIEGAHMLFITAGMGGGTGTGAAPVIARVAKEMGILTVGVVTKPFDFEGGRRMSNADAGLTELEANVDSLIVVLNEKLLEVLGDDVSQDEAFAHANDVLKNAVGGIAEIINVPGHVNVDFEDVRTVDGRANVVDGQLGRFTAFVRLAAGAQSAGAKLNGFMRIAAAQSLSIGVGANEFNALHAAANHVAHRVATAATDADDLDLGAQVKRLFFNHFDRHFVLLQFQINSWQLPKLVCIILLRPAQEGGSVHRHRQWGLPLANQRLRFWSLWPQRRAAPSKASPLGGQRSTHSDKRGGFISRNSPQTSP